MKEITSTLKDYLFNHNIFVGEETGKDQVEVAFALANKFNIVIKKGLQHATIKCIKEAEDRYCVSVPAPFYKGFPQSVYALTDEELLFDKLYNYYRTYELNNFSEETHSVLENEIIRTALDEKVQPNYFTILPEQEAIEQLYEYGNNLLESTRPLNPSQINFILELIGNVDFEIKNCKSHDTAIQLFKLTNDKSILKFLNLTDGLKFAEFLNKQDNPWKRLDLKRLNLKNKSRKLIKELLDEKLKSFSKKELEACYERKQLWAGLLHHIHYQPKGSIAKGFVDKMRGKGNISAYSSFEKLMYAGLPVDAAKLLSEKKGSAAVLRNLNYILSRCKNDAEVNGVLSTIEGAQNPIVLAQLLLQYSNYKSTNNARSFKFVKNNLMKVHIETDDEVSARKSILKDETVQLVKTAIYGLLKKAYAGKITEKVYIDEAMSKIALPLQETTSSSGYNILPKGSRIALPDSNIRFFTYWEKVDDIDLSLIAVRENGSTEEFSWRTLGREKNSGRDFITFSGDCTSGYRGGSEYFDIDLNKFVNQVKNSENQYKYLILQDNVYSDSTFAGCVCSAGFMARKDLTKGQIFEPKTVKTQFTINADSTFATLFAVDLETRELIWLNLANNLYSHVAGETPITPILDYLKMTDVLNVKNVVEMMAENVVKNPNEADIIFTDNEEIVDKESKAKIVHSYDIEYLLKLIN